MTTDTTAKLAGFKNRLPPHIMQMPERRHHQRTEIDQPAQICVGNKHIDCRIVDVSPYGADIEVADARIIPSRFRLRAEHDRVEFDCRIVWIKRNRVGLIFE